MFLNIAQGYVNYSNDDQSEASGNSAKFLAGKQP